jgi:DMSO/TMAO reductase YedYZ molybdopterin-dependent catalytic subunit
LVGSIPAKRAATIGEISETIAFIAARAPYLNHGNVPVIDEALHRISVSGQVSRPISLSLNELKSRFERVSVSAVMQCAGNRRADV